MYLPQIRKEPQICEAKNDKSSIDEPPEFELKDLPPHLEYTFLESDDKLPVRFLSPRDIAREGYTLRTNMADVIINGDWNWPISWLAKAPTIGSIAVPLLRDQIDKVRIMLKTVKNQSKPGNIRHKIGSLHQKPDQRAFFYNNQANETNCQKIKSSRAILVIYPKPKSKEK
nr:hypothetical protein [Tanacetum cinerariifolium]